MSDYKAEIKKNQLLNQRAELVGRRNISSFLQDFTMRDIYEQQIQFVEKQIKELDAA